MQASENEGGMKTSMFLLIGLRRRSENSLLVSDTIFYQYLRCSDIIPSRPEGNVYCTCKNVSVDVDAGQAGANDETLLRVLKVTRSHRSK